MNINLKRFILFVIILTGAGLGVFYREQINPAEIQTWIENTGSAAPVLFISIYILSTVVFLPGSLLTLLGGALFGPVWGTLYNLAGATTGAMISFLISRYLASNWVAKKAAGRTKQLIKGVENEGWRFVAFTRLVPIFPFNILNYALGLTKISFLQYSIASFIFMFPGALAYTYIGYIGKEAATGGEDIIKKIMLAIALFSIVIFIPRLIKKIRKKNSLSTKELKSYIDNKEDMLLLDVREPDDFNSHKGHIEQARSLPLEELQQHIAELETDKSKHIIIICDKDKRSTQAAKILSDLGFKNVQTVHMGMTDWNKHNYPLKKMLKTPDGNI